MALTLNKIYNEAKNKYKLSLIAGRKGMNKIMNWIYVTEDPENLAFLRNGELIITTARLYDGTEEWLLNFLNNVLEKKACGLVLNVGKNISEDDITEEVINFCNENNCPLFTLPWEIYLQDITKNLYEKIFIDSRQNEKISEAFLSLLAPSDTYSRAFSILYDYKFEEDAPYFMVLFFLKNKNASEEDSEDFYISSDPYENLIYGTLLNTDFPYHIIRKKHAFYLVCQTDKIYNVKKTAETIEKRFSEFAKDIKLHIGIGGMVSKLSNLSESFKQAHDALSMAVYRDVVCFSYDDIEFFTILSEVKNKKILHDFVCSRLNPVKEYDLNHNGTLEKTLHSYIHNNGSVHAMADELFCHRNTINYRIKILKEVLNYDLENPKVRFELTVSFLIEEYLKAQSRDILSGLI